MLLSTGARRRTLKTSRTGRRRPSLSAFGVAALAVSAGLAGRAAGQVAYQEQEPNDTRAAATVVPEFFAGDTITGSSQGQATSGNSEGTFDFLALGLSAPAGINHVELALTHPQASSMTMTLRGVVQVAGVLYPSNDIELVASTLDTPTTRKLRLSLSGGAPARVMLRIGGRLATVAPYTVSMQTTPVAPQRIEGLYPGLTTITTVNQGYSGDTELWLCDARGYPIPNFGNDDTAPPLAASPRSTLTRTLAAGRYFLALCDTDLVVANPNPSDDNNRNRPATDHPGIVVSTSAAANVPLTFTISGPPSATSPGFYSRVPATKPLGNTVVWFELPVGIASGCSPADVAGGTPDGPDGVLDGGDYIAFINAFAGGDALADLVGGGGSPPGDGVVDGSDYIAFVNAFSAGC